MDVRRRTQHRVRLSRACGAVSEDRTVQSIHHTADQLFHRPIIDRPIRRLSRTRIHFAFCRCTSGEKAQSNV